MSVIEIQNLKKYYGMNCGIEDVTFSVESGETVGFVGPNGAGKSTTIKILMGLAAANSGTATIFGQNVFNNAENHREIGYASSDSIFYKKMTVKEALEYTCDLYEKGRENIVPYAKRLDLDLNKRIEQLSLGNRKKVGIVSALLPSAKLLILDEPTNGLDPVVQHEFFQMLKEEKEKGATILLSTHNLTDVQNHCERAVIIKQGKIIASSTVEALQKASLKSVSIVFGKQVPKIELEGAEKLEVIGNCLKGDYSGKINELIKFISKFEIEDLSINDADLEKIIMKYYI